jgi:arylsulfatase A-like enzyme
VRRDIARLLTNIEMLDQQVGELIAMLKQDGVYDDAYIFFYSDHGGALPWMKREVLERGTHIPLIVRAPKGAQAGTADDQLVSAVDFAPTVLSLAGVKVPGYMQGQPFMGQQKASKPRTHVFAARDRMDTEYDRVRMVRDHRYRYVYNYIPDRPNYQDIEYRLGIPMMRELLTLREQGKLGPATMRWFQSKPVEELYDLESDPYELNNLAADRKYDAKLTELRAVLQQWTKQVGDMSSVSEKEMITQMWGGADKQPVTGSPEFKEQSGGIVVTCKTKGASLG